VGRSFIRHGKLLMIVVLLSAVAGHAHASCPVTGMRAVTLKTVVDGDTFFITDGAEVDLDGVLAPGSGGEKVGKRLAAQARNALSDALKQRALSLAFAGQEKDRYGRLKAQVFTGAEWVQGALLSQGLVRAAPEMAGDACAQELLAAEAKARESKSGHWGDGSFAVLSPDDLSAETGTFQIVEGKVQSTATQHSRIYLNFGANWRSDFTVTVSKDDAKRFRAAHVNLRKLVGKRVRVRGWLQSYYGPEMEIARPGAIENLEPESPKPHKRKRPGSKTAEPSRSRE
jgi:micrococcal nuclease